MGAIRETLKKNRFIHLLGLQLKGTVHALSEEARHRRWKRERAEISARYLASASERKLHIGCGPMVMEGWLNTDMAPARERGVVYLDITEPMPFADGSFRYIYSEHLIEHVSLEAAASHLRECYRILAPGGVLRIATPDLQFLLDYYSGREMSPVQREFLAEMVEYFHPKIAVRSPTILFNDFVREWGHRFIYDRALLAELMQKAGFSSVRSCNVGESSHATLAGLEQHGHAISDAHNELQTMILEGTRSL